MLRMEPVVDAGDLRARARQGGSSFRTYQPGASPSSTAPTATMTSLRNPCLAILLCKVNNHSKSQELMSALGPYLVVIVSSVRVLS